MENASYEEIFAGSYSLFFLTSGALGNLIDRIRLKYVIDFIYFSLIDFPVFNVAEYLCNCFNDCVIIIGAFLL